MRFRAMLATVLMAVAAPASEPEPLAVEAVIADQLAGREVAWILTAADGRRWERGFSEKPILPGSLLKPFAALAWLESHGGEPPVADCAGDQCWLPSGHGEVGLTAALARSCNFYFSELVRGFGREQIAGVALRYGLAPPPFASSDAWWGQGDSWLLGPSTILAAFEELWRRRHSRANALIVEGLRQAAATGSARGIGRALQSPALAKTGTAPCRHSRRAEADGLVIVAYPASNPRYTMLLQACGRTGRETAAAAGLALANLTAERGPARPAPSR